MNRLYRKICLAEDMIDTVKKQIKTMKKIVKDLKEEEKDDPEDELYNLTADMLIQRLTDMTACLKKDWKYSDK